MQLRSDRFSFQIVLQQLHLNLHLTPFKLKLSLKPPNTHSHSSPNSSSTSANFETKSIQIKNKITPIYQTFCFDCQLPYKRSREKGGAVYTEKMVTIRLVGNKVKENFEIGQCRINLAQFANKNSFYYENQIKIPVENCKDLNAYILVVFKLNRAEYNIDEQKSSLTFSIPNIQSTSSLSNKKILAVSREINVEDFIENHQTAKTFKTNRSNTSHSNRTFSEFEQEEESSNNYDLASKLESLYNKLESIASVSPSKINGIEVIRQENSEMIESSIVSSKNTDAKYRQLEGRHTELKEKYQDLVRQLGRMSQFESMFKFNKIVSEGESADEEDGKVD